MIFESHAVISRQGRKIGDGIAAFFIDARCRFDPRWRTNMGSGDEPPPLLGDVVFAAEGDAGAYVALNARTGTRIWRFATGAATIAPVIAAGGRVFAGDYGGVIRAFLAGAAKWRS